KQIQTLPRLEDDYISAFEGIYRQKKGHWQTPEGHTIIELAKGRYDFDVGMDEGLFASDEFMNPNILKRLMKRLLRRDYKHSAGALPSLSASGDGPWHRDTFPISDNGDEETKLMPFYYTVLIPLVKLTKENGSTVFIPGSHKLVYEEA